MCAVANVYVSVYVHTARNWRQDSYITRNIIFFIRKIFRYTQWLHTKMYIANKYIKMWRKHICSVEPKIFIYRAEYWRVCLSVYVCCARVYLSVCIHTACDGRQDSIVTSKSIFFAKKHLHIHVDDQKKRTLWTNTYTCWGSTYICSVEAKMFKVRTECIYVMNNYYSWRRPGRVCMAIKSHFSATHWNIV